MLQDNYIHDIVEIGGRALEYEDRFIVGCTTVNKRLYDDELPGGLLRIANERYYHFVVARALMSNYRYRVSIEKKTYDFIVAAGSDNEWLAVGEMKTWLSASGRPEIPRMKDDISKLRSSGMPAFFLVATCWPPEDKELELGRLIEALELEASHLVHDYCFRTIGWRSALERDFALLGFRVQ